MRISSGICRRGVLVDDMDVDANLKHCLEVIAAAAKGRGRACVDAFGRAADDVTLVVVAKGVSVERIREALDAGAAHIGENRVQEAASKFEALNAYAAARKWPLTWHMVGHLQTNKVKDALRMFDLIHSVDSLRLAQEIDRQAARLGKIQDVLFEVNVSGEKTKFGLLPEETADVIAVARGFKHIRVRGLMTIAPVADDDSKARPYFRRMKELRDHLNCQLSAVHGTLDILSMGMTDDFRVAVEEGSTMVRIGRGIFGERPR